MGQPRDIVKKFDPQDAVEKEQKEIVETLHRLGMAKADLFTEQIYNSLRTSGSDENKRIPVASVIDDTREVRAFSHTENNNIGDTVSKVFNAFTEGEGAESVVAGISNIITGALDTFLGTGSAETNEKSMYLVMRVGVSLLRIDLRMWYQSANSSGVTAHMEKISTVVAVKSIVDMQRIDLATFIYFYQNQMAKSELDPKKVKEQVREIRDLYNEFILEHPTLQAGAGDAKNMITIPPGVLF